MQHCNQIRVVDLQGKLLETVNLATPAENIRKRWRAKRIVLTSGRFGETVWQVSGFEENKNVTAS